MLRVVGSKSVKDREDGRSTLDEIARENARRMLLAAQEAEVATYLEAHRDQRDANDHALVVHNGKGRTRNLTFGSRPIGVGHESSQRKRRHADEDAETGRDDLHPNHARPDAAHGSRPGRQR